METFLNGYKRSRSSHQVLSPLLVSNRTALLIADAILTGRGAHSQSPAVEAESRHRRESRCMIAAAL